jgi:predicted histidine transporter YuiF (NhaC family)
MNKIHRVANIGEQIILNDWNKDNENAVKIMGTKILTVLAKSGFTRVITEAGEVYHSWYDVLEN